MVVSKIGLNLSVFQNMSVPTYSDFNISSEATQIANEIPSKANEVTQNFLGLGILITLFFYLVYKIGDFVENNGNPFASIRCVGVSAGICSVIGVNMLMIGYFTEFFHIVIFMGLLLVSTIWVWYDERR